jgi:hypothetical protein
VGEVLSLDDWQVLSNEKGVCEMAEQKLYLWAVAFGFIAECCSIAIAYRIHRGVKGLDIGVGELLQRSALVALFFTLIGTGGWLLSTELGLSFNGYALTGILLAPILANIINWVFGLDNFPAAFGIYILRAIPLVVLFFLATAVATRFAAN